MPRWSNRAPPPAHFVPFAFGLLAAAAVFAPDPAKAQGFNCRYAHYTDEAAICQDQALGHLDNQLTSVYNNAYRRLPPQEQRRLDQNEDAWVLQRRQCGADPNCITEAYHRRMLELQQEMGARDQQPQRAQPPGFVPPPPFRPYGGGAPVASGPAFPPPLPPGFRPPPAEDVEEQETRAPQIERRQPSAAIGERDTRAPQIEQRQSTETIERDLRAPQNERRQPSAATGERDTRAPQIEQRQSTETIERDLRAPPNDRRQSTVTTGGERDTRAPQRERQTEGSTEAPSRTTTVTTESDTAPEHAGTVESEPATSRSSSHRSKRSATATRPAKPATESAGQTRSGKPASDAANATGSERHEEAAVKPPPVPNPPPAPRPREETHPVAAKPVPPAPASGSSEPPAKPVIRWVDPPPSK